MLHGIQCLCDACRIPNQHSKIATINSCAEMWPVVDVIKRHGGCSSLMMGNEHKEAESGSPATSIHVPPLIGSIHANLCGVRTTKQAFMCSHAGSSTLGLIFMRRSAFSFTIHNLLSIRTTPNCETPTFHGRDIDHHRHLQHPHQLSIETLTSPP